MSDTTRQQFWNAALKLLSQRPPDFSAVDELLSQFDDGWDLIRAAKPPGVLAGLTHPVGGPALEHGPGPRGFLIQWVPGPPTDIHAHPSLLYMFVISGRLSVTHYRGPVPLSPEEPVVLMAGQSDHAWADNDRWDNFPHTIACEQPAWSLHIYGEDSGQGVRFDADGCPLPPVAP